MRSQLTFSDKYDDPVEIIFSAQDFYFVQNAFEGYLSSFKKKGDSLVDKYFNEVQDFCSLYDKYETDSGDRFLGLINIKDNWKDKLKNKAYIIKKIDNEFHTIVLTFDEHFEFYCKYLKLRGRGMQKENYEYRIKYLKSPREEMDRIKNILFNQDSRFKSVDKFNMQLDYFSKSNDTFNWNRI